MNDLARGFPLSRKLTLLVAGTATVALVLFAAVVLAVEAVQSRQALVRDLATQAEIIAATVAPALETGDWESGKKTLAALAARQQVVAAWLMPASPGGSVVAFDRAGQAGAPPRPAREQPYHEFAGRQLFYHMPVVAGGRWLGAVLLEADLREARMGLATYAGLVAVLLAVVLGLAWFLAARLQQVVSRPLLALAETARQVPRRGEGSVRALKQNDDEIGMLVESFNRMLDRMEADREALEESEKRFRTLAEFVPIGIYLTGCDGDCRLVNPRWCELTGLSAAEAQGDGWVKALHPDDRARVQEEWTAAVRSGGEFRSEYRYRRPDGMTRWVVGGAAPLREAGGLIVGYVGSVTDVTDRKELEQELLEISDREQARLGQEIHDGLCQHLVSTGFTVRSLEQRLSRRELPEATLVQEVAALIDGAITLAYDVVGGLFPEQLAGEGLASALQEFLHRTSQRHATRLSLEYPEPLELDPAQATHLFRIAQEAVTNALKHARPGHVHLRLVDNHGLVQLSIENDGQPVSLPPPGAGRLRPAHDAPPGRLAGRHAGVAASSVRQDGRDLCLPRPPTILDRQEPSPGLHL
jgi:PAS domain S-box-containing protein